MHRQLRAGMPRWALDARVGTLASLGVLAALTGLLAPFAGDDEITAVAMVLLLVVLLSSALWGYLVGIVSAVLADLLLNFFFVPPLHTFTVQDLRNVVALLVFLAVAVVGASMLALFRRQLRATDARRAELAVMLDLSRELAAASSPRFAVDALAHSITRALGARRCDVLQRSAGIWQTVASSGAPAAMSRDEVALANHAVESGQVTRRLTEQFGPVRLQPGSRRVVRDTFVPFQSGGGESGVVHITGNVSAPGSGDLAALLRGIADETGSALHRARLAEQAKRAEAIQRADEFKSVLLSSVSHDLRSPLTAIKAAVGSLQTAGVEWSEEDRRQLLGTIESQTDRLTDTVTDLLDMSRLEAGSVQVKLEPVNVKNLFYDAALATAASTRGRQVCVDAPPELWARADYGLLLRALTNLIENAAKYSTAGGSIGLHGEADRGSVLLTVSDVGPGIAAEDLPLVFEKFYRGNSGKKTPGSGLGLSIVRAMVELNRGLVTIDSSPPGTRFCISLPSTSPPT